nr:hypothetical protein [Sphingopyxis sp.]
MELLQFSHGYLAVIISVGVEIVHFAEVHIFGARYSAIAITVHQPESLSFAGLGSLFGALPLGTLPTASGTRAESNRLKFFKPEFAIAIRIKRFERGVMPLLKLWPAEAAITITIKDTDAILCSKINIVQVPQAILIRRLHAILHTVDLPCRRGRARRRRPTAALAPCRGSQRKSHYSGKAHNSSFFTN